MIKHTTTVQTRIGNSDLELTITGDKVTLKAIRHRVDQRDSDGPFESTVEEFQKILDEVQKAMPKRTVYRGSKANGIEMDSSGRPV